MKEKLPARLVSAGQGLSTSPEESLEELAELTRSAGGAIEETILQSRERLDSATLIGRGKLDEIRARIASTRANLLIFDKELSPTQQRNIEAAAHCRVIDRTQLILDIFARHARTREGQLQVELAQLDYMLPRLAGHGVEMSRLGGGIGTRGPGETQLEVDRRRIRQRIRTLEKDLERVRDQRMRRRSRRVSIPLATVPLVGYTNAGKSTLFNRLTQANVLTSPRMFATLDPTLRQIELPSHRKALASDTVGFIRNLPHTLVKAFRATLEEVAEAQLIVMVSDCSAPGRAQQDEQVKSVLQEIGAKDKPLLHVCNKADLLTADGRLGFGNAACDVLVSAKTGEGIDELLRAIDERLNVDPLESVRLRFQRSEGKELSLVYDSGRVLSREEGNEFILVDAQLPRSLARRFAKHLVPPCENREKWEQNLGAPLQ